YGNAPLGHEIENEYKPMMRIGVETATLELVGSSPREKDEVARNADIGGRSPFEVVFRRSELEGVL
ncbi:MAG TPA: hypothetical protein DIV79_01420, partial [Opitutae bacterium]|nr:hypothetical protein [Opitutae bacterium]